MKGSWLQFDFLCLVVSDSVEARYVLQPTKQGNINSETNVVKAQKFCFHGCVSKLALFYAAFLIKL